jgi:DNA-binding response OmpR family regulator
MSKILLVDDDIEFQEPCKMVLESEGYDVVTAFNVSEAESKIKNDKPDLIFLDIMMEYPDDGINLARKLKKQNLGIPVIMLSAANKVLGFEYGKDDDTLPCDDFLEKPVTPETLIKKTKKFLKN